MDSGPISTNLKISKFPIFVSKDSGPQIYGFRGPGSVLKSNYEQNQFSGEPFFSSSKNTLHGF